MMNNETVEKENPSNPLAEDFHVVSLVRFAFPSMVMMLFMGLYTVADTVFVARFVNTDALSSINIVCPVINIIVGLGTMLATGGSAVVAKKMGSRKEMEARRDFTLIVAAGAAVGLAVTAAGLIFLDEIILALGASEILLPYCRAYLKIQLLFAAGNMLQVLYQNLLVTAGRPELGLMLSVLAGAANIVFDYIFIVRLNMGISGAALGTGIGYLIPAVSGTVFFAAKKSGLHFECPGKNGRVLSESRANEVRGRKAFVLLESCANGVSEMVSQLSAAVTTFLFNAAMMRLLGENGVAAITVIIYSQFLLTTLFIGFSMGTAPVISYNYGSGDKRRLRRIVRTCFGVAAAVSGLVFLLAFFAGEDIAGMFAKGNETVFRLAVTGFIYFSFSFLFSGCNIFASALFTALSDGKRSAAISFLRTFGFITVFLLVLPRFLGVTGVWLAIPAAEAGTFAVTVCFVRGGIEGNGF